ncbi:MAG: phosphatidate cytidylyltransferase [Anaerolineales bacterium]|nr:MAG: phosphatidate cytidylyltransferase [Anaerolineales bacterium]
MSQDAIGLLASFAYVFLMIAVGEGLRRSRGYAVDFTRKFIHIAVGTWAYGSVLLFESRTMAMIPPLGFVLINAISYRWDIFKAMELGQKGKLGTVYFPLSFAVLIWFLWDQPHLLVAALMPMTWGDALAAVVGGRWGRNRYTIAGSTRSAEGSLTMLFAAWIATAIPLLVLATPAIEPLAAVGAAALVAVAATGVEALSPWGIDNLTVPAVSALVLVALL